jgi:hypothetical protein
MAPSPTCGDCIHFRNDGDHLERSFSGLTSMSSGRGAVRAADGLCGRHGLYLAIFAYCDDLALKPTMSAMPDSPAVQPPAASLHGRFSILSIRNRLASGGPR